MQQQGANQSLQYAQQPFQNLLQLLGIGTQPTMNQYHPATSGFGGQTGASMFGGLAQGYGNQMGMNMANMFPGQSPSTGPGYSGLAANAASGSFY